MQTRKFFRPRVAAFRQSKGITGIWVALTLLVILGFIGLATDVAHVVLVGHQLQNAADAASLAGAQIVRADPAEAVRQAIALALENKADGEAVVLELTDVTVGRYDRDTRTFTETLEGPNAVKVVARRTEDSPAGPVGLLFGRVFLQNSINVERAAIAMVGGGTGAGLITLDLHAPQSLSLSGTVTLNVDGGVVQVNSDDEEAAVLANGTPTLIAPELDVCGGCRFTGGASYDGDIVPSRPRGDPLWYLPEPSVDAAPERGAVNNTGGEHLTLQPGLYSGGIAMNNGSLTLEPGVYILDGVGLQVTGGDLYADGVMFYIIDRTPKNNVESCVKLVGNGVSQISPPDPAKHHFPEAALYEKISFFQSRSNQNEATFIGTSQLLLEGSLYFSECNVNLSGTSDGFGNQLIVNTIEVSGNGDIHINYDGRFPAPGNVVFLVE